jgi:hypothetical protein
MKFSIANVLTVLLILGSAAQGGESDKHSYVPPNGYVPDAKTAMRIAEAVWIPVYGEREIADEKPFKATLVKDVWTVTGSLPNGMLGGVAEAEISKSDGRIIRISHEK